MGTFIELELEKLIGKKCKIETTDGSIRTETVHSVESKDILFTKGAGVERVPYPRTLFFDKGEIDGVDVAIIKSVEVFEE